MNFRTMKKLALVGTAVLSLSTASGVIAAPNDAMDASITTSTTITAVAGDVMDFGVWLIGVPSGAPASTLVMDPEDGTIAHTPGAGVAMTPLPGAPAFGTVNVTLPAGANGITLQMSHGVLPNTLGTGLQLSNISYFNPNGSATGVMTPSTPVPITIANGSTGVDIQFGGTITATATPTSGAHGEVFNVAFAY